MTSGITILVKGAAFREKVRLAMSLLMDRYPATAAAYMRECAELRKTLLNKEGYWIGDNGRIDKDCATVFSYPPHVVEWLGMSEMQSMIYLGKPIGVGMKDWLHDDELDRIFKEECLAGKMGSLSGGQSRN